jgi:hypothetical protein
MGNAQLGLGTGHMQLFLPIWLQEDLGPCTVYGGGGYFLNPGAENRNYWFSGIVVEAKDQRPTHARGRVVSSDLEPARHAEYDDIGSICDSSWPSASGLQNVATTNRFSYYAGLQVTF